MVRERTRDLALWCSMVLVFNAPAALGQDAKLLPLQEEAISIQASRSSSQKVIVKGKDRRIRSRILSIAVDIQEELYELLEIPVTSQEHDIQILLYGEIGDQPPARLYNKGFSLIGGKTIITLDIHLALGVNKILLQEHITELLAYEIGLRGKQLQDEELQLKLQPWLASGLVEALRWKSDKADRQLYRRLFQHQEVYPITDLLSEEVIDNDEAFLGQSFRVSSGALVMALLNQPTGKPSMVSFIQEAPTFDGEQSVLISKHFPETTLSQNSLSKWWALQLATMSDRPAERLYTITETATALDDVLRIEFTDRKDEKHVFEPSEYLQIKELSKGVTLIGVGNKVNELAILQSRSFPSYRPLIEGYQQVLLKCVQSNKKKKSFWNFFTKKESEELDVAEMISRLEDERSIIDITGERVTDYLNWYELENVSSSSGNFGDYLKLKRDLDAAPQTDGGPIASYLDDVQRLYER